MEEKSKYNKGIFTLLFIIATLGTFFALKILHSFILPIIFSIFLAFVFLPIVSKIHKKTKLPWAVLSVLIILILILTISFLTSLLSFGLSSIITEYPKYQQKFKTILDSVIKVFPFNYDSNKTFLENFESSINIPGLIQNIAVPLSGGVFNLVKSLFVVLILTLFLLIEANRTSEKIQTITKNKKNNNVLQMSQKIIQEVVRYISIKFFVSLATGVIVYFGTLIIGLNFPIVWAFLAFIMNFIPTFGSICSVLATSIFSIMQFAPEWGKIIFVVIFMTSTNFLIGNIIEPKIEGENLDLSIFVIIVCILFWGWLWGFTGMILAVPLTVIIKIICENIEFLHPIAVLLSNNPDKTRKNLKA